MEIQVMGRLLQAADLVHRHRELELQKVGVTPVVADVLKQLRGPDLIEAEISRAIRRQPHTVSGLLVRMKERGLVTKQQGSRRNLVRVSITQTGRGLLAQVDAIESKLPYFDYLDEGQREGLSGFLHRVIQRTQELV